MNLKQYIEKYGKDNLLFFVPMRPLRHIFRFITYTASEDKEVFVPCYINEDRYKIDKNYKVTLECIYQQFGKEHFYISDLEDLIKKGQIVVYTKV